MAGAPPRQILGAGSYGVVVEPALDNISNTGAVQQFPGYVSKIMLFKGSFDTAKKAANNLAAQVPSLALEFTPYRRVYRGSNLPQADIQAALKKIKEDQGIVYNPANKVFVARMPNLGYSFSDFQKHALLKNMLHALPPETLCRQILKLLRVVKNLKDSEMVHADIRETNVMMNPYTGDMTIIDFDWLREKHRYYAEYPTYFYSHPPEEAILHADGLPITWLNNPDRAAALADAKAKVGTKFDTMIARMFWLTGAERETAKTILLDGLDDLYDFVHGAATASADEVYAVVFPATSFQTIDLYGLGVSLLYLFRGYPLAIVSSAALANYIQTNVKQNWCSPDFARRISVENAIAEFEAMIRANYPAIELGEVPDAGEEFQRMAAMADFYSPSPVPPPPAGVAGGIEAAAAAIDVVVHAEEAHPPPPPPDMAGTPPLPPPPALPPSPSPSPAVSAISSVSSNSRWSVVSESPAGAAAPHINEAANAFVGGKRRRKTRKGRKSHKGTRRSSRR